jgi:hypothetical protein
VCGRLGGYDALSIRRAQALIHLHSFQQHLYKPDHTHVLSTDHYIEAMPSPSPPRDVVAPTPAASAAAPVPKPDTKPEASRARSRSRSPRRSPPRKPKNFSGLKWKNDRRDDRGDDRRRDDRGPRDRRDYDRDDRRRDDVQLSARHGVDRRRDDRHSDRQDDRRGDSDRRRDDRRRDDRHPDRRHPDSDRERKPREPKDRDKKPTGPAVASTGEAMIIVTVNDRLGTKTQVPCLPSDPVKVLKMMVAAKIGRPVHEIMLKRQGERPFHDQLSLADYSISNGVQIDLELNTGD